MRARMTLWNNPAPAVSVVTPSAVESIELSEPSVETSVQPAPSEIPAKPQPDLKEIKRAARLLFDQGDIVELRALNTVKARSVAYTTTLTSSLKILSIYPAERRRRMSIGRCKFCPAVSEIRT